MRYDAEELRGGRLPSAWENLASYTTEFRVLWWQFVKICESLLKFVQLFPILKKFRKHCFFNNNLFLSFIAFDFFLNPVFFLACCASSLPAPYMLTFGQEPEASCIAPADNMTHPPTCLAQPWIDIMVAGTHTVKWPPCRLGKWRISLLKRRYVSFVQRWEKRRLNPNTDLFPNASDKATKGAVFI